MLSSPKPPTKKQAVGEARTPKRSTSARDINQFAAAEREGGKKSPRKETQKIQELHSMDSDRREEAGTSETTSEADRCRRNDGKNWRCPEKALPGHRHCQKHLRGLPNASPNNSNKRGENTNPISPPPEDGSTNPASKGNKKKENDSESPKGDTSTHTQTLTTAQSPDSKEKVLTKSPMSKENGNKNDLHATEMQTPLQPIAKLEDGSSDMTIGNPFRSVKARWLSSFRLESSKKEELSKIIASSTKPIPLKIEVTNVMTDEEGKNVNIDSKVEATRSDNVDMTETSDAVQEDIPKAKSESNNNIACDPMNNTETKADLESLPKKEYDGNMKSTDVDPISGKSSDTTGEAKVKLEVEF